MNTEECCITVGPIIKDITELCDFCIEFTKLIVRDPEDLETTGDQPNRIDEFVPGRGLESCQLCEVISSIESTTTVDLRISLIRSGFESRHRSTERRARVCGTEIRGTSFRIWADIGSSACKTVVGCPPISGLPMHQIRDLIQHWRRKRCRDHKYCPIEAKMPMPTRVLAISGNHARPSIMLVKSNGMKGRYLALRYVLSLLSRFCSTAGGKEAARTSDPLSPADSHCWGSVEKQPLRTTSTNFESHQKGIAFENLPRTFQDLVSLAQSIGIKYIWIDSLCIIQGNSQDWHSEAAKMGDVYRNAALVIAASGAEDSSRGLFINDRSARTVFKLPYRSAAGVSGTFNMMQSPDESNWHPARGPLETRAWTLQERYLAQRLITFMPGGITWSCKTISVDEVGKSIPHLAGQMIGFGWTDYWFRLLIEYTGRSLTFPSDRTEALLGIAGDLTRWSREDQYIPDYGVWQDSLMEQLLWFQDGPYSDEGKSPNKPSWSWTATGGAKSWPLEVMLDELGFSIRTELQEITITSHGHLEISGLLSTVKQAPTYVRDQYTAHDLQISRVQKLFHSWRRNHTMHSHVLTQDINDSYDRLLLGNAHFDNDAVTSYSHACLLGKQVMGYRSKPIVRREFIDDVVYHSEYFPSFVYWALLLERIDEGKYKRVGIVALLPVAYEAFQVQLQKFEII